jgi:hypothetical protein
LEIRQAVKKIDLDKSGLIRNLLIKDGDAEIFSEFRQPPTCERSLKRLLRNAIGNGAHSSAASSLLRQARIGKSALNTFEASCQLRDEPQMVFLPIVVVRNFRSAICNCVPNGQLMNKKAQANFNGLSTGEFC